MQGDLTSANLVRSARAEYKRAIREGRVPAEELINDPPEVLCGMQIIKLLTAIPGIKMTRAIQLLDEVGVKPTTPMESVPYTKAVSLGIKASRYSRVRIPA
jgi:hypothetical protein